MSLLEKSNILNFNAIKENFDFFIVSPLEEFGLSGFVFHVDRDAMINLNAEITDNYVEDNTAVQDHMAIRPLKVTLKSYIGELNFSNSNALEEIQQIVATKLGVLGAYTPELVAQMNQARKFIAEARETFRKVTNLYKDLWTLTKNANPGATEQQKAYLYFKSLMQKKVFVQVQTPFEFLDNMLIEGIVAVQPEDSKFVSEFSITLKQIRTTSLVFTSFNAERFQEREQEQRQDKVDNGKLSGKDDGTLRKSTLAGFLS